MGLRERRAERKAFKQAVAEAEVREQQRQDELHGWHIAIGESRAPMCSRGLATFCVSGAYGFWRDFQGAIFDDDSEVDWILALDPVIMALDEDDRWRRGWEVFTWAYVASFCAQHFETTYDEALADTATGLGREPEPAVVETGRKIEAGGFSNFHQTSNVGRACGDSRLGAPN